MKIVFSSLPLLLLCAAHVVALSSEGYNEEISSSNFPDGFFFGTGTSAYQIEGAYTEDGKSLSNWDVFSHEPGKIENNENGDTADDHYHRYLEDIELIHSLGMKAYRFSLSWSRILPRGRFGGINERGLIFYNNIINNLLQKGIEPFVTLHHSDLPQELEDRYGSWLSPLIQEDFVHYAEICFKNFGNRVKYWLTINEPNLYSDLAYIRGVYPPGHCSQPFGNCSEGNSDMEPLISVHNMLLSHAMAVDLYRRRFQAKQGGYIGINPHSFMYEPLSDAEADGLSVIRALAFSLAWPLDPLVFGEYPPEMRDILGDQLPSFTSEQKNLLEGSLDFIGINHYSTLYVKDCTNMACPEGGDRPIRGFLSTLTSKNSVPIGDPTGMEKFFVVPRGMEKIIDYIKTRYNNLPLFVTENGYSSPPREHETTNDFLLDYERLEFHKAYIAAMLRAMRNGADVRGYFAWSLMDNFEWCQGYGTRFGLYYVDRQTLERTPKLSAKWYASFLLNISHNPKTDRVGSASF